MSNDGKIRKSLFKLAQNSVAPSGVELKEDMMCVDAGLDSLDLIEFSYEIENQYQVDIDPAKMAIVDQTIGQLLDTLTEMIQAKPVN